MKRRALVAALLAALASPALAGQFSAPAYTQAADMASGRTPATTGFDGTPARAALNAQVTGALDTKGLTPPAVVPPSSPASDFTASAIPSPSEQAKPKGLLGRLFSGFKPLVGAAGAAAGAAAGWFLGGPLGAVIGAAAGFAISLLLSKLLA
ncbi:MAG: hypothetical protein KGM24_10440 [Elusimicrobia bacterium]|nr:hypothetical protein [Elusimicrobiota bacterium]